MSFLQCSRSCGYLQELLRQTGDLAVSVDLHRPAQGFPRRRGGAHLLK
ncbi:MAG: hypothetical protein SVR04_04495 [Spirochaetota bacterium]|nr:hypothetical protein [Spirochaetota bacterium]